MDDAEADLVAATIEVSRLSLAEDALDAARRLAEDDATAAREPADPRSPKSPRTPGDSCVVCWEQQRAVACYPCMHVCLCETCAAATDACPMCQRPVEDVFRVFLS